MEYSASQRINASPETIWSLLTDGGAYPDWNPTVTRVEGDISEGNKIKVFAAISPDRAFPVKVAEFEPNRGMTWQGGMPLGLFKGVRTFRLEPRDDGSIEFSMREVFSGLMLGMISKSMPDLQPAFDEFALALKKKAESSAD